MKDPFVIFGIITSIVLLLLAVEIFLLPDVRKRKKQKKKKVIKEKEEIDLTPWKHKVSRLEKKAHELTVQVEQLLSKEREYQRQLALEEVKNEKFLEKIKKEKKWQEQEHALVDKLNKQLEQTQMDLVKEQDIYSREHQLKLSLEREHQHLLKKYEEEADAHKLSRQEVIRLQNQVDQARGDIAHLKKENIELSRVKRDTQWIAKSDYDELKMQLQTLQKQLDRLKREQS